MSFRRFYSVQPLNSFELTDERDQQQRECMDSRQSVSKRHSGEAGAALVSEGMRLALGTGTTAEQLIGALKRRFQGTQPGLEAICTSRRTEELACEAGIAVVEPDPLKPADLYLDGADEIDPQAHLIKGRGGALLREKLAALNARRRIILADYTKPVARLGENCAVPVEIVRFAAKTTIAAVEQLGCKASIRQKAGEVFITDEGNYIADCRFDPCVPEPDEMEHRLKLIDGVIETGLFIGLCDAVILGTPDGARCYERDEWTRTANEILQLCERIWG